MLSPYQCLVAREQDEVSRGVERRVPKLSQRELISCSMV